MIVHISLFISVIIFFLSVIFILLVWRSKPNEHIQREMQEYGSEMVEDIKKYIDLFHEKSEKTEKEWNEKIKRLEILHNAIDKKMEQQIKQEKRNEIALFLYGEGYEIYQIAEILKMEKGIVEVIINMNKSK